MMKSAVACAGCLFMLGSAYAQDRIPDSLTVRASVQWVLDHNPAVRQADEGMVAARARTGQSASGYYPKVDAVASYTRLGPVAELFFPGLGNFELFPENNYDGHIGVDQTVFDFGKRGASVDVDESSAQTSADNVALVKSNLAFQTIQAFYAILFLEQSSRVQEEQVRALREHLLITERKVQNSSATEFDVLTTQVRVAAAETQKIDVDNELAKEQVQFRRLLGAPPATLLNLRGDFTLEPVGLSLDSLLAVARLQRAELILARDAERTATLRTRSASLNDAPSLKVELAYGVKNGYIPNLDVLRGNWVAAALVEVPIFDGQKTGSMEQEAEAQARAAAEKTSDVDRQVEAEVQQSVDDVLANRAKVETSELQVQQAKKAVSLAALGYENGVSTNLDVIDAHTALAEAELVRLQTLFRYVVSRYALERAVGGHLEY